MRVNSASKKVNVRYDDDDDDDQMNHTLWTKLLFFWLSGLGITVALRHSIGGRHPLLIRGFRFTTKFFISPSLPLPHYLLSLVFYFWLLSLAF